MSLWSESAQALTRAAPTAAQEGADLSKVKFLGSVRVLVKVNGGGNLTNVTMQGWIWDDEINGWSRAPNLDFTAAAVGVPSVAFERAVVNRGRVLFASSGTTVSAGTTLTVILQGS